MTFAGFRFVEGDGQSGLPLFLSRSKTTVFRLNSDEGVAQSYMGITD
jgi:hypothetical protein